MIPTSRVVSLILVWLIHSAYAKPAADWRESPPKPGPEPAAPSPKIERADLANGLAVLVHERHDVPLVLVRAVLDAGDAAQPRGKEGLAAFTAEMLQSGTERRSATQLADDAAILGAELASESAADGAHAELASLKSTLPAAVELLSDLVVHPTFPASELERVRTRRKSEILERADDPAQAIRDVLPAVVYGAGHPYAAPHLGTAESVAKLTRDDVLAFYRARYRPGGAALIFVGDVTLAEARALAEKSAFGAWPKARVEPVIPGPPSGPPPRGIVLVDKPAAQQSQVGFALLSVPRAHPDFIALEVADACLGGTFSSRLNLNLREDHGYSYGAATRFAWRRGPSYLIGRAGIRTDVTSPAVAEFRNELRKLSSDPPSEKELALAKAQLIHGVTGDFETLATAADAVSEVFVFGLPLDFFHQYEEAVAHISPAEVQRAIAKHLAPERAILVIVGDRAKVEPDFLLERRDAVGRILR